MQNWLLWLRRRGISVLLVHHAGTNGRQRGTSRREDALDTVIALRRPEDYSPEQGARFEIHLEKLRNRVDSAGAMPFEARLDMLDADGQQGIHWSSSDLKPPMLQRAGELFSDGMTVREIAATLRISKSEAGRLRIRALNDAIFLSAHAADCENREKLVNEAFGVANGPLEGDIYRASLTLIVILLRALEDDCVMKGWQLDKFCEYEAARFDRPDGLIPATSSIQSLAPSARPGLWFPRAAADAS